MLEKPYQAWLLAALLGAISVAGFAPLNLWPVPLMCIAALAGLWQAASSAGRSAALGFAFGLGQGVVGVSWIYVSLHDYGKMPFWLAAPATLALAAYMALYGGLAGWLIGRLRSSNLSGAWAQALLMASAWALAEWLRGTVGTGFPWLSLGYSQIDGPLAGFGPLVGVYGMSWLAVFSSALLGAGLQRMHAHRLWLGTAAFGVFAVGLSLGAIHWTQPDGAPIRIALVQPNVAQDLKFIPGKFETMMADLQRAIKTEAAQKTAIVLLPETAIPRLVDGARLRSRTAFAPKSDSYNESAHAIATQFDTFARNAGIALVTGIPIIEEGADAASDRYANSAIALGKDAPEPIARYDKHHLVPFGEMIPWGFGWFVKMMQMPLGDFTRGGLRQAPFSMGGARIAVNICYEDVFGEEIAYALGNDANNATMLLNLSNIAWFGHSLAPHQHLQISRLRALETGRPMLRATNTGATAVIDEKGRVAEVLPFFTQGTLRAQVQGMRGTTPYVWVGGNAVVLVVSVAVLGVFWRRRARLASSYE